MAENEILLLPRIELSDISHDISKEKELRCSIRDPHTAL